MKNDLLPKITVVTVVKNGVKYIERSIQSVIKQNYINVEYIIYDACSTDGTQKVLNKYKAYIDKLVIEPDSGPADALNKAFSNATGDIYCWINADDYYLPDTFFKVGNYFFENPDTQLLYGNYCVKKNDRLIQKLKIPFNYKVALYRYLMIAQPSSFWRRSIYNDVGGLDSTLKFCFDYDFFLRVGQKVELKKIVYLNIDFSVFEIHAMSKTGQGDKNFKVERKIIRKRMGVEKKWFDRKITKFFLNFKIIYLVVSTHGIKNLVRKFIREDQSVETTQDVHKSG